MSTVAEQHKYSNYKLVPILINRDVMRIICMCSNLSVHESMYVAMHA